MQSTLFVPGVIHLLLGRKGESQAYVEKPVLPGEVPSNDFFSESDTGVEGWMSLEELWMADGDVDKFTISSGKFAECPPWASAAVFAGFCDCPEGLF